MLRRTLLGTLALSLACGLAPAMAQSDADSRALIERLRPQAGGPNRGIRLPSEAPAAPAPGTTAPAGLPAVSITVRFASGSDRLTPEAERALEPLGRALASAELASYRFRIEGHTDTVGDAGLNKALSERRAAAVRDFLTSRFHVAAARLEAVGLGFTQPLVATPPETNEPRNRRVQIVNLGA